MWLCCWKVCFHNQTVSDRAKNNCWLSCEERWKIWRESSGKPGALFMAWVFSWAVLEMWRRGESWFRLALLLYGFWDLFFYWLPTELWRISPPSNSPYGAANSCAVPQDTLNTSWDVAYVWMAALKGCFAGSNHRVLSCKNWAVWGWNKHWCLVLVDILLSAAVFTWCLCGSLHLLGRTVWRQERSEHRSVLAD